MAKKTLAELQAEEKRLKAEYDEQLQRDATSKRVKKLQNDLRRAKYREQFAMADRAAAAGKRGLRSIGKSLVKGMKSLDKYAARLEKQEQEAKKRQEAKSSSTKR